MHFASYKLKEIWKGAEILPSNYHNVLELANGNYCVTGLWQQQYSNEYNPRMEKLNEKLNERK